MENIVFEAEGRPLFGKIFKPDNFAPSERSPEVRLPGILFIHGLNSDQSGYRVRAETASNNLNVACLTFDLSGHGKQGSTVKLETLTPRDHLADLRSAYDELSGCSFVDPNRIGVCGASYGAYLAVLLTRQRRVKRLLMRAPAMYSDAEYSKPLTGSHKSRVTPESMAISSLATFAGETLILESERDESIPHEVITAYLRACPRAGHQVIAGATHVLTKPEWREQFMRIILAFFRGL